MKRRKKKEKYIQTQEKINTGKKTITDASKKK